MIPKLNLTFLPLLLGILILGFDVSAQKKPKDNVPKIEPTKTAPPLNGKETASAGKEYEEMLEKLKQGDFSIDFVKFRLAFTETKNYAPYGGSEERSAMFQAFNERKYKEALSVAEKMLEKNFVEVAAHFVASEANFELGKAEKGEFHLKVFKKLMEAILKNDGLTAKTGIISIGISEQYFVMSYLGFQRVGKALVREEGSIFDVHTAENPQTKETRKFYFNIDKVFGRF